MTISEFSNEFDVLYNNVMSNQAPGLDEYEKSVFLTKAQDEIIKAYFSPMLNKMQQGFDGNERRQIDFSMLVRVKHPKVTVGAGNIDTRTEGVAKATLPTNALMVLNEIVTVTRGGSSLRLQVVPIAYQEYSKLMSKPYKRPLKWQAWRLQTMETSSVASPSGIASTDVIVGSGDAEGVEVSTIASTVDLIASNADTITDYEIRYVKRPNPIIVGVLEGVTVGGYAGCDSSGLLTATKAVRGNNCELDPILHHEILQRAVELAKAAYTGDLNTQIALGQNSETNMGAVAQYK